ncbi:putative nuclease HARBI1 [Prorops nasuta]|uniref:putative nuclease HARBI1 n=1 Tax=Prorops nasuta TaxID=863751 RepID=UPI0034CD52A4
MDALALAMVSNHFYNINRLFVLFKKRHQRGKKIMLNSILKLINPNSYMFGQLIAITNLRRSPRIWSKIRSSHFWEDIILNEFTDEDWVESFRMKKIVFYYIVNTLKNSLQNAALTKRDPISVEKAVAITVFYLASCCEMRVVGNLFGVSKTSVWRCLHFVVNAINKVLGPIWIKMYTEAQCAMIAEIYKERSYIPQLIGAIDGTHIPLTPPSEGYRDYINRKVRSTDIFRNINCQAPGSSHHAAVFKESNLFKFNKDVIPQNCITLNGCTIPYMIIGDPAYPLLQWLIKGYTKNHHLTPEEESFNVHLNSARVDIEIAFGRLKARWRRIMKKVELHYTFVPDVVYTCCILHNIVESHKEEFRYSWMNEFNNVEFIFPQPNDHRSLNEDNVNATEIREVLKNYLTQFPLRRSFR